KVGRLWRDACRLASDVGGEWPRSAPSPGAAGLPRLLPAQTVRVLGAAGAGLGCNGGVVLRSELDSVELGLRRQGGVLLGSELDRVEGRRGLSSRPDRRGIGVGRAKLVRDPRP